MRYFRYFFILIQGSHAFILDKDSASTFLIRKPRENDFGGLDEVVGDNFERECIEESCENEEFHEVYDDWFSSTKKLKKFKLCISSNNGLDLRSAEGKRYLRQCFFRETIQNDGVVGFCNDKTPGNYADPTNRKGFIQCNSNGLTTFVSCGTGLVWDVGSNSCNWPSILDVFG